MSHPESAERQARAVEGHRFRLSIVVPALEEASALPWLLGDLAPLRASGHEILVVDGGSRDGTDAAAAGRADRVLRAPRGRAQQMNAGAREARGDVFWFLHADTRVPPGAATVLLDAVRRGRAWGRFRVRLSNSRPVFRLIATMMNLRSCLTGIATGDQGLFVTRRAFDAVGGFPAIALMEDIAMSRRLKRVVGRPACLRVALVTSARRWERRGALPTILLMWRLRLAYWLGADPSDLARRYR